MASEIRNNEQKTRELFNQVLWDRKARVALARAMREGKNISFQVGDSRVTVKILRPELSSIRTLTK